MTPPDTKTLPAPLTPVDCELRDFKFMPLDVVRLRDSDLATKVSGEEFRCAVLLWCASWHQVPAASLPDDDETLAAFAGFGRVVKEWLKVRKGALRGWVKCTDGRLYHPVVAEKANESWLAKLRQRLKTECGRIKKHNERHHTKVPYPEFEDWMAAGCPVGQPLPVAGDSQPMSSGQDDSVAGEKHSKGQGEGYGQGQGQGQGQLTSKTQSSSSQPPTTVPELPPEEPERPEHNLPLDRHVQIALLLRAQGVQATSQNPIVAVTWAENPKVTDELLNVAITKAKAAKPGEQIPVKYLARIVENLLAEQDAPPPAATPQKPKSDDWSWKRSNQGIEAKGRELGMFARGGESYADFAARIQAKLDEQKGRQQ
jgi:hypothetical protein